MTSTDATTPPDSAIRTVWLDHQQQDDGSIMDVVALEFNHLEISEEDMPPSWNGPRDYAAGVQEQNDPGATLGSVNGAVAYVAPPNNSQGMVHPGGVTFMRDNVQIRVEGYYPTSALLAIAESLN